MNAFETFGEIERLAESVSRGGKPKEAADIAAEIKALALRGKFVSQGAGKQGSPKKQGLPVRVLKARPPGAV